MSNRPAAQALPEADVLSDVVRSLGLETRVFCRSDLGAPWSMGLPQSDFAHFHVVERGACWLQVEGEKKGTPLSSGDLVVVPHGRGHVLSDAPARRVVPLSRLLEKRVPGRCALLQHGGTGPRTTLLCGSFRFAQRDGHPLLALLPPVLHLQGEAGRMPEWLGATLRLLTEEARESRPGGDVVLSRLTDLLFIQVLRAWMLASPGAQASWLSALADARIGRSLALMHGSPAKAWTVDALAREVGMSRSPFAARFVALVGEPPLSYLTRWRMRIAADLLRAQGLGLAEVASRVGYESEAAFSKAFKRSVGEPPGAVRRGARMSYPAVQ